MSQKGHHKNPQSREEEVQATRHPDQKLKGTNSASSNQTKAMGTLQERPGLRILEISQKGLRTRGISRVKTSCSPCVGERPSPPQGIPKRPGLARRGLIIGGAPREGAWLFQRARLPVPCRSALHDPTQSLRKKHTGPKANAHSPYLPGTSCGHLVTRRPDGELPLGCFARYGAGMEESSMNTHWGISPLTH